MRTVSSEQMEIPPVEVDMVVAITGVVVDTSRHPLMSFIPG
jgi:hypothetical protein